jgi:GTP cyclohydrolase III
LIEPQKIEAAIARLEAEKQRRIDAKVEKGEAIRVPLYVGVGEPEKAAAAVENAKAQRLAKLREAGETREVHFDEPMVIITGVPRA